MVYNSHSNAVQSDSISDINDGGRAAESFRLQSSLFMQLPRCLFFHSNSREEDLTLRKTLFHDKTDNMLKVFSIR